MLYKEGNKALRGMLYKEGNKTLRGITMDQILRISNTDTAGVALVDLSQGETATYGEGSLKVLSNIPAGHKVALTDIQKGTVILKYGNPIGEATEDIPKGAHIHTHNLRTCLKGAQDYEYHPADELHAVSEYHPAGEQNNSAYAEKPAGDAVIFQGLQQTLQNPASLPESVVPASFHGFPRKFSRPGIRNELWILPTVGCVDDIAEELSRRGQALLPEFLKQHPGAEINGIYAFPHPYGCSQLGDDQDNTRKILANLAVHPNAGGVLILGLGCENSGIEELMPYLGAYDPQRIRFLKCQDVNDEIEEGLSLIRSLFAAMAEDRRTEIAASELVVGLKCGGSDGFSGITANPAIGVFSDILTAMGGSTILTEVPEMFGAETLLMNRCIDRALFEKTVRLINDFKNYYEASGMPVYENPSPGNKKGGITTLEEKALGCTQKSGTAPVSGVLAYGERLTAKGLNLLSAPGNDLVASTALAASGAQLVLFSTGRGTPFGCPVPTVKISSNSALFEKKARWIDFDAGVLLSGTPLPELGQLIFKEVLEIASGKTVKNEQNNCRGIAIFKNGITL